MMSDEPIGVADRMDVVVTAGTAQSVYPSAPEKQRRDVRQALPYESLSVLPDEFLDPVLAVARRCRVWVYLLEGDDRVGVEVLNAPLKRHHKALVLPPPKIARRSRFNAIKRVPAGP